MLEENQKQYELIFILSPELKEEDINSFKQEFEKDIKNLGGNLKKQEKIEKRELAYPIKKFQSAHYLIMSFLLNSEKIEELSAALKHKKELLRSILTSEEEYLPIKAKEKKKKKKKEKSKLERFREVAEEISEEEVQEIKKEAKKKEKPSLAEATEGKKVKLEEIDKKLEEILGI